MPKFKVEATIYTDVCITIEADDADDAYNKARDIDGGEWIEDGVGDFQIGHVSEVTNND